MEEADKNSKSLVRITRVGSTPTTGIASSSKSKDFGLFFFFCSVSYTLVFSGKILTMALAEETLSRAISVTVPLTFAVTTVC